MFVQPVVAYVDETLPDGIEQAGAWAQLCALGFSEPADPGHAGLGHSCLPGTRVLGFARDNAATQYPGVIGCFARTAMPHSRAQCGETVKSGFHLGRAAAPGT